MGLYQGNLSILEGLDTRRKCQLCGDVECTNPVGINAILLCEIKVGFDSSEANDLLALLNSLEGSLTGLGILMEPDDVLRQERVLYVVTQRRDAHLALKDSLDVVRSEDLDAPRKPNRCARTHHGRPRRRRHSNPWVHNSMSRRRRGGRSHRGRRRYRAGCQHGLHQSLDSWENGGSELVGVGLTQTRTRGAFCER